MAAIDDTKVAGWVKTWKAKLGRGPFVPRRVVNELLNEAAAMRHAAQMSYVSHLGLRMDTPEQELLRLKVVAKYRADLGITDDDGWQLTGLSGYAQVCAERDRLNVQINRLEASR